MLKDKQKEQKVNIDLSSKNLSDFDLYYLVNEYIVKMDSM